ncbi:hypothetical protein RND81_06G163100 [Saponaria officinalis]|uniref:RING-type E3 ubiquitin transferase n=1 Tax=Saponaria officinalis TaxID=3572 RepID=A0AAW1K7E5_SAPOF
MACYINYTHFSLDQAFDLDEALTMPPPNIVSCTPNTRVADNTSDPESSPAMWLTNMQTVSTTENDMVCSVCMEGFCPRQIGKQIPCGHVYHVPCISPWLSLNNSCPLCRNLVSDDRK